MVRVFTNGPGDLGSIPGRVMPKTFKMVLDASLLNTQHYKVRINGKVEKGVAPFLTPCCCSNRKGSLRVTLDYGRQPYLLIIVYNGLLLDTWNSVQINDYYSVNIVTASFPLLPGRLWPRVVVPVKSPSIDQIDLIKNYSYSVEILDAVLRKITYNCFLKIIISYFKPSNCVQTNDYYMITWNIYKVKLYTLVEGDRKVPFSIATIPRCGGRCYSI